MLFYPYINLRCCISGCHIHLQNVTLGGTGKDHGDRHPKISDNVLIGASATVLGNIRIGEGAQIAAGSLVLKPVAPHTMVAGSPAKPVGTVTGGCPCIYVCQHS
jgi:serine O-acetyltransferase